MNSNSDSIDFCQQDESDLFVATKNHSLIVSSRHPQHFNSVYLRKSKKRRRSVSFDAAETIDLKAIMTELRSDHPSEVWKSKQCPNTMPDRNSSVSKTYERNCSTISNLKLSQINSFCEMLHKQGVSRKAVQLISASTWSRCKANGRCWPSLKNENNDNSSVTSGDFHHVDEMMVQFKPNISNHRLMWCKDVKSITLTEFASSDPLRSPLTPHSSLVRDKLFLLDDHCLQHSMDNRDHSAASSSRSKLTSKLGGHDGDKSKRVQEQLLERALARHSEALTDSVLQMVLDHFQPIAESFSSAGSQGHDAPFPSGADATLDDLEQRDKFSWEHVLSSLQLQADKLVGQNVSMIKSEFTLPDVHLSADVLARTQHRLMGLYGTVQCPAASSLVPTVLRKHPGKLVNQPYV